ncbi:RNase J family beta-CASP ribonuclease [Streptomyces agglomeratus]|uniref:Ribonuclease J n=1 Tax=Streptomyces agglomeratus TaxID=285458 RepID=A0A1E5PFW4_9ACTN|nr:ribonuclease J [Streptomyces agglomeratus]OEJ28429.1 RNase J family beta-CASP ribonuclease [Streptomyces agglomeratus]OEJ37509.1 RNase J family beta-CASP ribonuclease [Streptomyces agglomeratus]OEJ48107.1 RNase J family beta-CASP ribonuclease [Streptomyces agglomeratus]OEJ50050.1 RNase J family beta-CASP ribonuclease [Streptomyces agglomeratus]OEJ57378.1 RNase J family beta-CASP ribonuclease [Streptomyces agglomeratus]
MSHPHPELKAAPPLPDGGLRVVALGGLGEIGRNMTVFEYAGKLLIVDCGVLFPEETQPGVDVILPDFTSIRDRLDDVVAVVLTHGHEDHIGGVPYLLRERSDIPVVGSKLTLAFLEAKLKEHGIRPRTTRVREGDRRSLGPFDCEFVAVNHSIPDSLAIAIRTGAGMVLHTGDFKMDQFPLDERITDLRAFARLGEEGVDLFLTDSTNAEVPGFTTSERDLNPAIEQVMRTAPRRVIVSSFASHVHRIQQVLDAAHQHGRKVAFVGRSMVRNMGIARELGYLKVPSGLIVSLRELEKLPDNKITLVCTGSQGEPMAALSRMANRDHMIRIGKGDTVLLASSLIPGNENAIYRVINGLTRWGAHVVHKGNAKVHVSGHASAGELVYCYNIVKPRHVMPVHGEWRHLRANGDLAIRTGVDPDRVVIAEDGVVVDLVKGRASITGKVPAGYVYVDGMTVGGATEASLKDRLTLAEEGVVTVVAIVDADTGALAEAPDFLARGFVHDDTTFEPVVPVIEKVLATAAEEGVGDAHQLEQLIARAVASWAFRTHRRKPLIIPVIIDA